MKAEAHVWVVETLFNGKWVAQMAIEDFAKLIGTWNAEDATPATTNHPASVRERGETEMMTNTDRLAQQIDQRFKSGNSVPVERVYITHHDWKIIRAVLASLAPAAVTDDAVVKALNEYLSGNDFNVWQYKKMRAALAAAYPALTAQVAALTAQCDGLRKDAERYKWLRDTRLLAARHDSLMANAWYALRTERENWKLEVCIDSAIGEEPL